MAERTSLKDLQEEQIEKAFQETYEGFFNNAKVQHPEELAGVELVRITTEEDIKLGLDLALNAYMAHEPISLALGFDREWTEEVIQFWEQTFRLHHSLMFVNEENQEPMALRTTKISRYDDKIDLDSLKSEPLKEYLRFASHCDRQANFFGRFGTEEAFHFNGLAVAHKYKQRHLGTHLIKAAIDMVENLRINPVYVKVEGSSNFSKKIFENVGFEEIFEQPYATWKVGEEYPIQNTGEHKSQKVYGKRITPKPPLKN